MKNAFGEVGVDYTVENVQDALKTMLVQLEEASRVIVPRYITVPKFSMANVTDPNKALKEVLEAFTEMELLAIGVHIRYGGKYRNEIPGKSRGYSLDMRVPMHIGGIALCLN